MKAFILLIVFSFLSIFGNSTAVDAGAEHVGIIKSLAGEVAVVRGDKTMKATTNMKLMKGDLVRTGADGKVGLIFEDDTVISMGNDSRIMIEDFQFQPSENKLSFIARFFQGTASFLSGQIAKLAPNMVRFETPHATVGVRGTHFLVKVDPEGV